MILLTLVLGLFGGRLVQLQAIEAAAYAEQATEQRLRTLTLPAERGDIVDRAGQILATTVDARAVYADPKLVENPPATARKLAALLGGPTRVIERKLHSPGRFVYLAREVTPERARKVLDLGLAGIGAQPESKRVYPADDLAGNVVGFVGEDGHGLAGLEYRFDDLLSGRDGSETVEIGAGGQRIPMGDTNRRAPERGRDVRLTIDRDIQWRAQQAIADQVKRTKSENGSVIVMDPETGDILALASTPTVDPNDPGATPAQHRGNPPLQDVYEPGSTNKVITAAAGLETEAAKPNTPFTVPASIERFGHIIHDSEEHAVERLTLSGVLAKSSNVGTVLLSEHISSKTLYRYMRAFGFGRTATGFPGESPGIVPPPREWDGLQRSTIPFGQGVAVNALQMASVYATIANHGVRVGPHLVDATRKADGSYVREPPADRKRVISKRTARDLTRILEVAASDEGTAPVAQIPGYRVAGKTGTAQRSDPECGCYRGYTATFVGYAPADDPKLVAEVVLQDPKVGHYGGDIAAPVFKDVMSFALQSQKIPPTGTDRPKIRLHAD